jgi:phosphopantetheinyl transferase (holo-ACP synthase)
MIGNDIVDIQETRRSTNWERPRFMLKIFSILEQKTIHASTDPFSTVWQFWSMKESAYKVFIQAGGEHFFNPSKIECRIDDSKNGEVKIGNISLITNTLINTNYIFTTAVIDNDVINTQIFQLAENSNKSQSSFLHEQIINDFAKSNSLNSAHLILQKSNTGIPILFYKNKRLNTSLSISHHGKYGVYSFLRGL